MSIRDYEFETVFRVNDDGTHERVSGIWAPECYHDDERDIDLCGAEDRWEPLTGWTGQYGYHGAVMHSSETIGKALERWILETPGTYCTVVVDVLSDDDDPEPAGWAILRVRDDS